MPNTPKRMTESELIDKLLDSLREGGYDGLLDDQTFSMYPAAINKMRAYGLIQGSGNSKTLLEKGHQVLEAGGFDKWKAAEERRASELHQATLYSAKSTGKALFPNWITTLATVIGTLTTVASLVYATYQTRGKDEAQKELTVLRKQLRVKDSLLTVRPQSEQPKAGLSQTRKTK